FNREDAHRIVQNSSFATSNAQRLFREGNSWKDSYAAVGEMLKNGQHLDEIDPEEIRSITSEMICRLKSEITGARSIMEKNYLDIITEARSKQ
ncbi:MAG: hypothetical protein QXN26_05350, partial [Thermoplasmataceae archaeon]